VRPFLHVERADWRGARSLAPLHGDLALALLALGGVSLRNRGKPPRS
jgi:hypothetical protein